MTTHETTTMTWSSTETTGRTEDDCLRWLWRELYAADGASAVCVKCRAVRKFHRVSGRRAQLVAVRDRCGEAASLLAVQADADPELPVTPPGTRAQLRPTGAEVVQ